MKTLQTHAPDSLGAASGSAVLQRQIEETEAAIKPLAAKLETLRRQKRVAAAYAKMVDLEREAGDVERELDAAREQWESEVFELKAARSSNATEMSHRQKKD